MSAKAPVIQDCVNHIKIKNVKAKHKYNCPIYEENEITMDHFSFRNRWKGIRLVRKWIGTIHLQSSTFQWGIGCKECTRLLWNIHSRSNFIWDIDYTKLKRATWCITIYGSEHFEIFMVGRIQWFWSNFFGSDFYKNCIYVFPKVDCKSEK